jgi:hypothetical protein
MPAGCKGKYTTELATKICEKIAKGIPNKFAAGTCGISQDTFYRWKNKYPEFSEMVEKAGSDAVELYCDVVTEAAKDGSWQAAAWWNERRHRREFGRNEPPPRSPFTVPELTSEEAIDKFLTTVLDAFNAGKITDSQCKTYTDICKIKLESIRLPALNAKLEEMEGRLDG